MNGTRYTTVHPEGSRAYLAPHQPACPAAARYMAVHRVVGGGWGIVDRRSGKLLAEARPGQHRYPGWQDVQAAASALNRRGGEPSSLTTSVTGRPGGAEGREPARA
jgi:hypothetical protein